MNALYQALRAIDPHSFELLVFHLLRERYAGVDIKHIEGGAGDQGLDVISGQLDERPTIWQCKCFANGVKQGQRGQIRDSLNRALKYFTPLRWVLCLNVDMDSKALQWFQKLTVSRAADTRLDLLQGSDIVHQLIVYQTVRERFFPNTVLNTTEIRELVAMTGDLTSEQLASLTAENADLYLQRLQAHDARFNYAVTFTRDRKPAENAHPDEILRVSSGDSVLHVYPRDLEALRERPPQAKFTIKGPGVEKFQDMLRTGTAQTFRADDITGFTSDFDFLRPATHEESGLTLHVMPRPATESIPLRITLGKGDEAVTYDYVPFRLVQAGTEEATYESAAKLPFRLTIVLRRDGTGRVNFQDTSAGSEVHEIRKFLRGITAAITSGAAELYDLAQGRSWLRPRLSGTVPAWVSHYTALMDDAVAVADAYGVTISRPVQVTDEDAQALDLLTRLLTGTPMPPGEIRIGLEKVTGTAASLRAALAHECSYRIITPGEGVVLFGMRVPTGPLEYELERALISNVDVVLEYLDRAPIGAAIDVVLQPTGPITARRHSDLNAGPILQFKPLEQRGSQAASVEGQE